jgi:hypothetical protein
VLTAAVLEEIKRKEKPLPSDVVQYFVERYPGKLGFQMMVLTVLGV